MLAQRRAPEPFFTTLHRATTVQRLHVLAAVGDGVVMQQAHSWFATDQQLRVMEERLATCFRHMQVEQEGGDALPAEIPAFAGDSGYGSLSFQWRRS